MKRIICVVAMSGLLLATIGGWYAWHARETADAAIERLRARSAQLAAVFGSSAGERLGSDAAPAPADATAIHQVCQDVGELDRTAHPLAVVAGLTAPIAHAGQTVSSRFDPLVARVDLMQGARQVTAALSQVCEALEPLAQSGPAPDLQVALARVADQRETLRAAADQLRDAQTILSRVDERQLGERERQLLSTLRGRLPDGAGAVAMLAEMPTILGYDRPATYLVLGQNNDELRPTGGFIGTSGYITLDHGKLVSADYGSSFSMKLPPDRQVPPPEPLQRYMGAAYWHLPEANWWPDYPSSARQAQYFSDLVHPAELAGVVSLNQDVVASLLGITGPLTVDGYDEVVTSENVRQRLDYQVHVVSGAGEAERKQFIGAVFSTLLRRLTSVNASEARRVPAVALRSLERQDVLIWFNDPRSARAASALHWDGSMLPASGDYLYVVSANVGENKVNRDVTQEARYDVSEDQNGELIGHVRVAFSNQHDAREYWPYKTTDYLNFMRIYVPTGSELLSSRGLGAEADTSVECGRTTFSGLVDIPVGQQRIVELYYRLPPRVTAENYQLVIQKQPGVGAFPMQVGLLGDRLDLGDNLDGFRVLRPTGGQVVSSRQLPSDAFAAPEPACQVWTAPPLHLPRPSRIVIPGLNVDATVAELGISATGVPELPASADVVGWYRQSARPGQVGNAVMVGRPSPDSEPAVFDHLGDLAPGNSLDLVDESNGRSRYVVQWVHQVDRSSVNLTEVMGPTTQRWLTLISWKGGNASGSSGQQEWTIVRATLAGSE